MKQAPKETGLMFTTSGLALVPSIQCPNYCASKAGLHSHILVMREQLRESNVKVIELLPPAVQSELHDYMGAHGKDVGMPLKDFTDELWAGLQAGKEDIAVGTAKDIYQAVEPARKEQSKKFNDVMDEALKEFLA